MGSCGRTARSSTAPSHGSWWRRPPPRTYGRRVRTRMALLAAVLAATFPASAMADDPPVPTCLTPAGGQAADQALRGVHVGVRAKIRDSDGKPLAVNSVSYCV